MSDITAAYIAQQQFTAAGNTGAVNVDLWTARQSLLSLGSITSERAASACAYLIAVIDAALADSAPQSLLDPGAPDIETKRGIRGRLLALQGLALQLPAGSTFPQLPELKGAADAAVSSFNSTEGGIGERNAIVEQLPADIANNAKELAQKALDAGKWTLIIGAVVVFCVVGVMLMGDE